MIYWRETAGSVTKRILETLASNVASDYYITLLCMGFFTKHVISHVLMRKNLKGKLLLFEVGLRDYMDYTPKPRILKCTSNVLNDVLLKVLNEYGLSVKRYTCEFCDRPVVTVCYHCNKLLCHQHMIICPVYNRTFCSPETGSECFKLHKCR